MLERQGHNASLAWTGTTALIGVAAVSQVPELSVLSVVFLSTLWLGHIHLSSGIRRIGSYIAVYIEPKVPGLQWEKTFYELYSTAVMARPLFHRVRIALSTNYTMFGITAILVSAAMMYKNWPVGHARFVLDILLTSLALLWFTRIVLTAAAHPLRRTSDMDRFKHLNQRLSVS